MPQAGTQPASTPERKSLFREGRPQRAPGPPQMFPSLIGSPGASGQVYVCPWDAGRDGHPILRPGWQKGCARSPSPPFPTEGCQGGRLQSKRMTGGEGWRNAAAASEPNPATARRQLPSRRRPNAGGPAVRRIPRSRAAEAFLDSPAPEGRGQGGRLPNAEFPEEKVRHEQPGRSCCRPGRGKTAAEQSEAGLGKRTAGGRGASLHPEGPGQRLGSPVQTIRPLRGVARQAGRQSRLLSLDPQNMETAKLNILK